MQTGVSLQHHEEGVAIGAHVHHESEAWLITSNYKIFDVLTCPLVTRLAPGNLGTYLYPEDAVFTKRHVDHTKVSDLVLWMKEETVESSTPRWMPSLPLQSEPTSTGLQEETIENSEYECSSDGSFEIASESDVDQSEEEVED